MSTPRSRRRTLAPDNSPTRPAKSARVTPADLVVLAILSTKPSHGYDIVTELQPHESGDTQTSRSTVSKAQIYYSLNKLLSLGHISGAPDSRAPAGPERAIYRVSPAGRRVMSRSIASPDWANQRSLIPFTVWLMIVGHAEPEDRAAAIALRRAFLTTQIESASIGESSGRDGSAEEAAARVIRQLAGRHAIEVLRMEREILDAIEPMLGGKPE